MNYKLHSEKGKTRTYINEQGTEVKTVEIYRDRNGKKWFAFVDLLKIPVIRTIMAKHITDLYGIGLTMKDLQGWIAEEKKLLKSADPEKYEKLYSMVLEKERVISFTADPLKQNLALCSVYVLRDEERIDYFDEEQAQEKIKEWKAFPEMVAFFLSWHTNHILHYMKTLEKVSVIASKIQQNPGIIQPGKR